MADALSADATNSLAVRKTLRERARYEVANNSYAKGIMLTLANDCIGTGPRLQLLTDDDTTNRVAEAHWAAWMRAAKLPEKLRTMRVAKAVDGEVFGVLTTNPGLRSSITLDMQLVECDQVTSLASSWLANDLDMDGRVVDGVVFDEWGNPQTYMMLRQHPGDTGAWRDGHDLVPAESVVHWFRADRPGQHRGIPEITPALILLPDMRRYTLAVLGAAETAADFAAVLYTDSPANGDAAEVEPMDVVELEKRMATTLPDGWKLGQIKAEQPGTTYGEFKREILNEIARCLNMPYNVAAGNSSGYNYASGRLDHQTYYKAIRVEQAHLAETILDAIFTAWVYEAARALPELSHLRAVVEVPHQWFWDGVEHVDPAKEANAQSTRLASNTTTLAAEYAKQGKDWEAELRQRAKEVALMKELGLSNDEIQPSTQETPSREDENDEDD